jgi:hypothetical protein
MFLEQLKWRKQEGVDTVLTDFVFHERQEFAKWYPEGGPGAASCASLCGCTAARNRLFFSKRSERRWGPLTVELSCRARSHLGSFPAAAASSVRRLLRNRPRGAAHLCAAAGQGGAARWLPPCLFYGVADTGAQRPPAPGEGACPWRP